jgi:hypothetical protein
MVTDDRNAERESEERVRVRSNWLGESESLAGRFQALADYYRNVATPKDGDSATRSWHAVFHTTLKDVADDIDCVLRGEWDPRE